MRVTMQTENSGIWDTLMPAITRSSLIQLVAGVGLAIASSMSAVGQVVTASDAVLLRGAGSTFAAPLYKRWIEEYAVVRPSVSIAYEAVEVVKACGVSCPMRLISPAAMKRFPIKTAPKLAARSWSRRRPE